MYTARALVLIFSRYYFCFFNEHSHVITSFESAWHSLSFFSCTVRPLGGAGTIDNCLHFLCRFSGTGSEPWKVKRFLSFSLEFLMLLFFVKDLNDTNKTKMQSGTMTLIFPTNFCFPHYITVFLSLEIFLRFVMISRLIFSFMPMIPLKYLPFIPVRRCDLYKIVTITLNGVRFSTLSYSILFSRHAVVWFLCDTSWFIPSYIMIYSYDKYCVCIKFKDDFFKAIKAILNSRCSANRWYVKFFYKNMHNVLKFKYE